MELVEQIDKTLRESMVTIGTSIEDAKTGQMWAYDSERLAKEVLSVVHSYYASGEDELLTEEGLSRLAEDYPLLDFSFEDDYREEVRIILKAQAAKSRLRTPKWIDEPDKAGEYWMSACNKENRCISPRIMRVIDYQRPGRGLEVDYDSTHNTVPIKTFVAEYYPAAKWLFIEIPVYQLAANKEANND